MNVVHFSLFLFLGMPLVAAALFEYDRAIHLAAAGDLDKACESLKGCLVDAPDRADLLYDTGVLSYKKGEFVQACAYFDRAAAQCTECSPLKQQALFNSGNSCVQLKKLPQAIEKYEAVLALNPHHEQAHHNNELVKKMLEQEKQEEQKQEQNKQQDQQQNQNSSSPNDQKCENQDRSQQSTQQNSQKGNDPRDNEGQQSESRDDQREQENRKNSQDQANNEQNGDHNQRGEDEFDGAQQGEKRNKRNDHEQRSPHADRGNKQPHQTQATEEQDTREEKQSQLPHEAQVPEMDEWMQKLLTAQENNDMRMNKQLMQKRLGSGTKEFSRGW